jgi:cytokinin dehydrogenase
LTSASDPVLDELDPDDDVPGRPVTRLASYVLHDPPSASGTHAMSHEWRPPADAVAALVDAPSFDGELCTGSACDAMAEDFGHIVHRRPLAVLRARSVDDVVAVVRFARERRLQVAPRGQGHSTFGQAQVSDGVIVDLSALRAVHDVDRHRTTVDAGARWDDVLAVTRSSSLIPPVLPDHLGLSVGGTLSVGGISGTSFRHGAQVDHVTELEVVTGAGELVRCTPAQAGDLFDAVLAGLGQCGIIVRATLGLMPAPTRVRVVRLWYPDPVSMTRDQRLLVHDERFDYVLGVIAPASARSSECYIEAATHHSPPRSPSDRLLLAGLSHIPGSERTDDRSEEEWSGRVGERIALQRSLGLWDHPHPWLDLLVPGSGIEDHLTELLGAAADEDVGRLRILLYPLRSSRFQRPLLRLPEEDIVFLCDVMRTARPTPEAVARMLARNRSLLESNRARGGTLYPISAVELRHEEWREHFGGHWPALLRAKHRYDPDCLLTPGPGIFPPRRTSV